MQTFIRKDIRNNWRAESVVMINDSLQLSIRTTKQHDGALNTCVSVGRVNGDFVSTTFGQDFFKTIARVKYGRVTSKVVEKQHKIAVAQLDLILQKAKEFYSI